MPGPPGRCSSEISRRPRGTWRAWARAIWLGSSADSPSSLPWSPCALGGGLERGVGWVVRPLAGPDEGNHRSSADLDGFRPDDPGGCYQRGREDPSPASRLYPVQRAHDHHAPRRGVPEPSSLPHSHSLLPHGARTRTTRSWFIPVGGRFGLGSDGSSGRARGDDHGSRVVARPRVLPVAVLAIRTPWPAKLRSRTIIGLYKTEVIRPRGPWPGLEAVELATLHWVDWFNNRRILEPIGNRPPAEAEAAYYRQSEHTALAA